MRRRMKSWGPGQTQLGRPRGWALSTNRIMQLTGRRNGFSRSTFPRSHYKQVGVEKTEDQTKELMKTSRRVWMFLNIRGRRQLPEITWWWNKAAWNNLEVAGNLQGWWQTLNFPRALSKVLRKVWEGKWSSEEQSKWSPTLIPTKRYAKPKDPSLVGGIKKFLKISTQACDKSHVQWNGHMADGPDGRSATSKKPTSKG